MIYGKYAEQQELVTTVPPSEVAKQTENPKASAVTSHKTLPQTNDFVKSYSLLGGGGGGGGGTTYFSNYGFEKDSKI